MGVGSLLGSAPHAEAGSLDFLDKMNRNTRAVSPTRAPNYCRNIATIAPSTTPSSPLARENFLHGE
jgi:hypothetical protein